MLKQQDISESVSQKGTMGYFLKKLTSKELFLLEVSSKLGWDQRQVQLKEEQGEKSLCVSLWLRKKKVLHK